MNPNDRVKSLFSTILGEAGIKLSDSALQTIIQYHEYLRNRNDELNLTRIHNLENSIRKHYVDSLIILPILAKYNIKLPSILMDLGSGPGLPGIPIAIARPDIHIILTEGRRNRCDFLRDTLDHIDTGNASVLDKKVNQDFEYPVPGVITRAFSSIPETFRRIDNVLERDGLLILLKGPNCDDEVSAMSDYYSNHARLLLDHHYTLPESSDRRRLIVYRRISDRGSLSGESFSSDQKERVIFPDRVICHDIESAANQKYKFLKSLRSSRMIKKQGFSILSGSRFVEEAIRLIPEIFHFLVFPSRESAFEFYQESEQQNLFEKIDRVEFLILKKDLFNEIDQMGTGGPLLVFRTPEIPIWNEADNNPGVTLFLPFSDPENLGAAIRSAFAFNVNRIVLLKEAASPFLPRALRASAGASLRATIYYGPSLKDLQFNLPVFRLDMNGRDIQTVDFPENFGLIIGMEGGQSAQHITDTISIPIHDAMESLNASVSASIALYEISRRRKSS